MELIGKERKVSSNQGKKLIMAELKMSEKTARDALDALVREKRLSKGYVCNDWDIDRLGEKVYYFSGRQGTEIGRLEGLPIYTS